MHSTAPTCFKFHENDKLSDHCDLSGEDSEDPGDERTAWYAIGSLSLPAFQLRPEGPEPTILHAGPCQHHNTLPKFRIRHYSTVARLMAKNVREFAHVTHHFRRASLGKRNKPKKGCMQGPNLFGCPTVFSPVPFPTDPETRHAQLSVHQWFSPTLGTICGMWGLPRSWELTAGT